jgi:polysaccharide biosynthesis transport protein
LTVGLLLGLLAGVGAYFVLGPAYSARTQVLVSQRASVPTGSYHQQVNRYGERGDHVQIIQTELIVERAFQDHGLDQIPELAEARDPLNEVVEGLKVTRSAGQETSFDNVLDIEFLHADKEVARAVVQAIVEAYRDYLDETRSVHARQLYESLLDRQETIAAEIRKLEGEYHDFRKEAPVFLKGSPIVTAEGSLLPGQSRYEVELDAIEQAQNDNLRRRSRIRARLATLQKKIDEETPREALEFWVLHSLSQGDAGGGSGGGGSGSGTPFAVSPEKAQLDQQLLTARLLEQRLLHALGEEHSTVRNVRRQIETILEFYMRQGLTPPQVDAAGTGRPLSARSASLGIDLVAVYRETLEGQLKELEADDDNLALLHEDATKRVKEAELFDVEDQRMKDQIALKKRQWDQLFQQIANYDLSREQEGYRLQQIAQVRVERSLKRVIKIVGACGILGLMLIFSWEYYREWSDTSLRSLDVLRTLSGTEILGQIPLFVSSTDADRAARESGLSPSLCYYHRPGSLDAEAFRALRTTLFCTLKSGEQVLQMSSSEPGDGKSTAAGNLAVALAQSGKSVLLIDGDLRRPTLHDLFGLKQEVGLSDVLLREIEWINAVRPTPVEGLAVMTAGLSPDNPAELLSGNTLGQILQQARKEYDLILLDSPPVLAVSDPCIVSPHVDGMLLVVRMRKNRRATLQRTRETLQAHGVPLLGVIANGIDEEIATASGYDYDAYGSYYRSDSTESSVPRSAPQSASSAPAEFLAN